MKRQSPFHLFVNCRFAKAAWGAASWTRVGQSAHNFMEWLEIVFRTLKSEDLEKFVFRCWGLWNERNPRVWNWAHMERLQVMEKTRNFVKGWPKVQRPELFSCKRVLRLITGGSDR
ncbi:unnamed protein product [Cuscuta epithymum]|uniref:Reverse transcriptase zinc-binding domain-containing protein n=1 Tax=Cuscuta epithymum TaxID=186058 RepID=A0AAV0DXX4_9ASTE|nr:unnamed protein product [Cuscuta epithymum]